MFRGAIVGLGNVALNGHLPAWLKNSEFKIVAGIDSDPARGEAFQKLVPGASVFSSLEACGEPLDFVDIATPPHLHFPLIRSALEKNLDVLCEKPLVLSEEHAGALEDLRKKSGKALMTVHNWKYAPICRKITEIVQKGDLGNLKYCAWYVLRNGPAATTDKNNWRLDPAKAGGGILIDHGWHALYLVLGWMNLVPQTIHATLENRQYEDLGVEDTAKLKIEFQKKDAQAAAPLATAEIFLTWASRVRRNWGVIEGDQGILRIEEDVLTLERKNSPPETFKFDAPLSAGSHHPDWFGLVIEEFFGELSDEGKRGNNFTMAKSCLRLIEQSKRSSEQGGQLLRLSQGGIG